MIRLSRRAACSTILLWLVATLIFTYQDNIRQIRIPEQWPIPFQTRPASTLRSPAVIFEPGNGYIHLHHPIDDLISRAAVEADETLKKQTFNLSIAAAAYRQRRRRHPPPGFEQWYRYAVSQDCVIVEDFFDQIYKDIEPFWGLDAADIRGAAASLPNVIHVSNGKVLETDNEFHFVRAYIDMLRRIESHLPDIAMPINEMDEPRVTIRWEDMSDLVKQSALGQDLDKQPSVSSFPILQGRQQNHFDPAWIHEGPYWNIARDACHPRSRAKKADLDADFSIVPDFPSAWPEQTYKGFVANWTVAKDPCAHAHLRNLHGSFVEPISQSTSRKLTPIFSGSKLALNNDILLPPAMYWLEDEKFTTNHAKIPWSDKRTEALWRGSASGGRNREENWTRFQRHRLLSMLNGSQIRMALNTHGMGSTLAESTENHESPETSSRQEIPSGPGNFPLPNQSFYPLQSFVQGMLPDWIMSLSDAAFTWLTCFPATRDFYCSYTGPWYSRGAEIPLHRMFEAKYLPDVDGNSFSGRYRAFLKSNSLPIKATIYDEWHDDRLIAWKHFVPMDNTFVDLWAILEYLVSHDDAAQKIALEGREWAEKVLRKEDMLVYIYRLILEYARVSSDARHEMGWTDTRTSDRRN